MKKLIYLMLFFIVSLSVNGCSHSDTKSDTTYLSLDKTEVTPTTWNLKYSGYVNVNTGEEKGFEDPNITLFFSKGPEIYTVNIVTKLDNGEIIKAKFKLLFCKAEKTAQDFTLYKYVGTVNIIENGVSLDYRVIFSTDTSLDNWCNNIVKEGDDFAFNFFNQPTIIYSGAF